MTARTRSRKFLVGSAVLALLAPLAIVLGLTTSASAAVGPRPHEVYMYKVEKHVDLSGEYPDNYLHEHLYCNPGDIALDGMWRVDHVDFANPQLDMHGDERDVVFHASYGDPSDLSQWHYRMENFADGNAQVKLFLTCIRKQTEQTAGHKHNIQVRSLAYWPYANGHMSDNYWNQNSACNSDEYAVAPGYQFVDEDRQRMIGSYPSPDLRGWQWAFEVDDSHHPNAVRVNLYLRCIKGYVWNGGSPSHSHQLPMKWRTNTGNQYFGYDDYTPEDGIQENRLSCDDGHDGAFYQDYKAMVGAFWLYDWHHQWYLGMDPRPKTRAYKFWDEGGGGHVLLNIFCIKSRTGKQIRPF